MSDSDDDQVPMNKPQARKQQSIIDNPSSLEDDDDTAPQTNHDSPQVKYDENASNGTLAQDPRTTMNANVPSSSVSAAVVVGNTNGSNGTEKPQEIDINSNTNANINSPNDIMNANMESKEDLNVNSPAQSDYNLISPSGTLQAMTSFQMAVQSQDLNDQQLLARFAITLTYLLFSFLF